MSTEWIMDFPAPNGGNSLGPDDEQPDTLRRLSTLRRDVTRLGEDRLRPSRHHHRVGDRVTIHAEIGDVERLVIIPVVALQPEPAPAPGATLRAREQAELLAQRRGVTCRSRANPSGLETIEADLQ